MIWTGIATGFTIMIVSLYPSFKDLGVAMSETIPKEMAKAFNMDMASWGEISGYYKTYFGFHIIIILAIFSCSMGSTIISNEEKDRTSEFLFSKPISRWSIFSTKVWALLSLISLSFILQTLVAFGMFLSVVSNEINWGSLVEMHLNGYILCLFFGVAGLFISQVISKIKNYMGPVVGLVMGSYFLHAIGKAIEETTWISKLSPFHYLGVDGIHLLPIIIFFGIILAMLFIAHKIFERKDIGA